MKTLLIIVLAVSTVCLGTLWVVQTRKSATQQARLTALQAHSEQLQTEVDGLKNARSYSEKQNTELSKVVQSMSGELKKAQATQSNAYQNLPPGFAAAMQGAKGTDSEEGAGFGKMLAGMMKDPDMKKFIRDQQRTTMDQLYAPLVKQMGMTPDEAERFKDFMADNAMKGAEKATSLFGAGATNREELVKTLAAEQKTQDEELKSFLGDTRYQQYKDYQETVGERTMLNMFRQQSGSGENAITDAQSEQLLAVMKEEKQAAMAAGLSFPGSENEAENLQKILSDEQGEKTLQALETVNQKVYDRAGTILNQEQLQSFSKFQSNQMQMMRMGMTMARKFMGGDKAP